MGSQNNFEDKILITIDDIKSLFKRKKWTIYSSAIIGSLFLILYALTQPIKYKAEATFREKNNRSGSLNGSLAQVLVSDLISSSTDAEISALIKSRKIMAPAMQQLNMQADLFRPSDQENSFHFLAKNLKVEWALWKRSLFPSLKEKTRLLQVIQVVYDGEVPLVYKIKPLSGSHYEVFDVVSGKIVGEGHFDEPFANSQVSFVIQGQLAPHEMKEKWVLQILPLEEIFKRIYKDFEVEALKIDKTMYKMIFSHPDRHIASTFVNKVMESFQDFLKDQRDSIAEVQLEYLKKREEESGEKLKTLMQNHAEVLSADLSTIGNIDSRKEIDFLAQTEHQFKQKLLENDLEVKRLKQLQPDTCVYYEQYSSSSGDPAIINTTLKEIRELKQEQEGLELALQKIQATEPEFTQAAFEEHLNEIKRLEKTLLELDLIIINFAKGDEIDVQSDLFQNPRYLIKIWYDKLKEEKHSPSNLSQNRQQFFSYLENLSRLLHVHRKILQERLTFFQNIAQEYQGINLKTAKDLYINCCHRLMELESDVRQKQFFIAQIEEPDFNVTSLSSSLKDMVSLEMINKANEIGAKLRDEDNQSAREQERLKNEIAIQKEFFKIHLKQTIHLMELDKQLIKDKINALQSITLELVKQQITLLEKSLQDFAEARLENLKQEKEAIQEHLKQIHNEMALLPQRWVAEQMIDQQVKINQLIVEEIAKLVESKNITHNLEVIQSSPIDKAISPIHPKSPRLFVWAILGAFLGGFLSSGFVLMQAAIQGVPASKANLNLIKQHLSGSLSSKGIKLNRPLQDRELDTLRRTILFFESAPENKKGVDLLLLEREGAEYSEALIHLLSKKKRRVLILNFCFPQPHQNHTNSLINYLEGKNPSYTILKNDGYDEIILGKNTRYDLELLASSNFLNLKNEFKSNYDWIITLSHALPLSVEAEVLEKLYPNLLYTIENEPIDLLCELSQRLQNENKKFSWILLEDEQ